MLSSTWESQAPIRLERTLFPDGFPGRSSNDPESTTPTVALITPRALTSGDLYREICRRLNQKGYAWE